MPEIDGQRSKLRSEKIMLRPLLHSVLLCEVCMNTVCCQSRQQAPKLSAYLRYLYKGVKEQHV